MHVFSGARRDSFSLRLVTVETRQLHVTPVMNDVPVLTCTKRGRVYMCMYMCALLMMRTISRIKNTCILLHSVHVSRQKRPEEHARIFLPLRRALVRLPTRNTYYVRIPLNVKTVAIDCQTALSRAPALSHDFFLHRCGRSCSASVLQDSLGPVVVCFSTTRYSVEQFLHARRSAASVSTRYH
jgi:hypothetical protein